MNQKKVLHIEGMSCVNCKNHVEKALNGLEGVTADVDLEANVAHVTDLNSTREDTFRDTLTDAGYTLTSLEVV